MQIKIRTVAGTILQQICVDNASNGHYLRDLSHLVSLMASMVHVRLHPVASRSVVSLFVASRFRSQIRGRLRYLPIRCLPVGACSVPKSVARPVASRSVASLLFVASRCVLLQFPHPWPTPLVASLLVASRSVALRSVASRSVENRLFRVVLPSGCNWMPIIGESRRDWICSFSSIRNRVAVSSCFCMEHSALICAHCLRHRGLAMARS